MILMKNFGLMSLGGFLTFQGASESGVGERVKSTNLCGLSGIGGIVIAAGIIVNAIVVIGYL